MIPIPALVAKSPRTLRPEGRTWDRVVNITGQPRFLPNRKLTKSADSPVVKQEPTAAARPVLDFVRSLRGKGTEK